MNDPQTLAALEAIGRLLTARAGLSPALLTPSALESIVCYRARELGLDLPKFEAHLGQDERELVRLASSVSVPETWLFRYRESFELLRARLSARRKMGQPRLEIASLGCATGAEAWSVAACALSCGWPPGAVRVHAVDRSEEALRALEAGLAPTSILRDPLPEWASPWIVNEQGSARISAEVRQCVQPLRADFVATSPALPAPLDVILCRNVLIYLTPAVRATLRRRLVDLAGESALILLGHADGINTDWILVSEGPHAAFAWRARSPIAQRSDADAGRRRPTRSTKASPARDRRVVDKHACPSRGECAPTEPRATSSACEPTPTSPSERVRDLIAAGDLERAEEFAQAEVRARPSDIDMLELFAGVLLARHRMADARRAYEKVVYLEPRHGPALLALAELSMQLGHEADAARYRLRASRTDG